ncbi:VOC family protein [Hymenobacter sp. IS2118]|uniref:VOC family protein n=1 Tax=Hymenobacter sp. IS2118 TaxID=1505605 RepID=UPI000558E817|nr:VOC family protein [Hymenobacter sp. IS2118]
MIALRYFTIHVPNVWQTCEWYRQVFGFAAILSADATAARLDVPGQRLVLAAHDVQEDAFGPRRLNSFLSDPPAFHLNLVTADLQQLFDYALAHGAVPVRDPIPDAQGQLIASLRDLNVVLIQLIQLASPNAEAVALGSIF